jgi:hypothetical protein
MAGDDEHDRQLGALVAMAVPGHLDLRSLELEA